MKNLLLLLPFTSLTFILCAQQEAKSFFLEKELEITDLKNIKSGIKVDSTIYLFSFNDNDTVKEIYTYDINGNMTSFLYQSCYFNDTLTNHNLYTYTYDGQENKLSEMSQSWSVESGVWLNDRLYSYTYDNGNNLTSELYQEWEENEWIPKFRYSYSYANVNSYMKLFQMRENGTWVNDWQSTYTMDEYGNVVNEFREDWVDESWVEHVNYTYTYDESGNQTSYLWQFWDNNEWDNYSMRLYTYDLDGNNLTHLKQNWEANAWVNEFIYTYTYDEYGNRLSWLSQGWLDSLWLNLGLRVYTYNSNGDRLTYLSQYWLSQLSQWFNQDYYIYSYNEFGEIMSIVQQNWYDQDWINEFKTEYNHLTGQTSALVYSWNEDSWEESLIPLECDIIIDGELILTRQARYLALYHSSITGIENSSKLFVSLLINVFPNPASNQLKIKINPEDYSTNTTIELINQAGSVIKIQTVSTNSLNSFIEMNVADIPSGIYVLTVTDGIKQASRKIIISK